MHNEEIILQVLSRPLLLAEIARLSGLPRSTVEYNLRKLIQKKMVGKKKSGKRNLYFKTGRTVACMHKLTTPLLELPGITIYRGLDAIEHVWKEILSKPRESRLIGIQPRKSFSEAIRKSKTSDVQSISQEIGNRRFIIDAIVHEDLAYSLFRRFDTEAVTVARAFTGRLEDMVKVPNDFLDEKAEFFLIDNEIFIIDWYKEFAVKISNKHMFDLFSSVFYAVKAYGKRYEQGKYIEELIKSQ